MDRKTQKLTRKQLRYIGKFNCCTIKVAAEQKARATYEDVIDPLRFLREREVVHFQRFGEALRGVQDKLAEKRFFMNDMKPMSNKDNDNCGCNN